MTEPNHIIEPPRQLLVQLIERRDFPGYRDVARALLKFLDHPQESAGRHTKAVTDTNIPIPQNIMNQIGKLQVATQEHVYALQRMKMTTGPLEKPNIDKLIEDAINVSDMLSEAVAEIPTYNGVAATLHQGNGNGAARVTGK